MSRIAQRLRREFEAALKKKIVPLAAIRRGEENAASIQSVDALIDGGHHPLHAVYTNVTNLISVFIEELVELPGFHRIRKFLVQAQDQYCPGYPPLSPLTVSYYAYWTTFDAAFGQERETMGHCFLALADLFQLDPLRVEAVRNLCQSRLGIYELAGETGKNQFRLRELITDRELETIIPTGFTGNPGDLILVRVLPPFREFPSPSVAVTTPYVLLGSPKADWLDYFERQQILAGAPGSEERLYRHMKWGKDDWYWSEFVFCGYVNHRSDAIFLAGLPDRPETQPHHKEFDEANSRT
jgi:hypothetical protein